MPPFRHSSVRQVAILLASVSIGLVAPIRDTRSADDDKRPTVNVQLTNGTTVRGRLEHRDPRRIRVRAKDGFATTVPMKRVHRISNIDSPSVREFAPLLAAKERRSYKTIELSTEHRITIRKNPTTQVHIRIAEWPNQTFLLWFPEVIDNVWAQWDAEVAKQDFAIRDDGAYVWERTFTGKASVVATLTPRDDSLLMEIAVTAAPEHDVPLASPGNCLHFSAAPDFACNDFSRIFVRVKKRWRSFLDLRTAPGAPEGQSPASVIYREGFKESKRPDIWTGHVENRTMPDRVDHPLIFCKSKSSNRVVATASEDYQGLFYNQSLPYLLCVHSAQAGVKIPHGKTAVFREIIWFLDDGLEDALRAYKRDVDAKVLQIERRADSDFVGTTN